MRTLTLAAAIMLTVGCSHANPIAPTEAVAPSATVIQYDINIPDAITAERLVTLNPAGVAIPPIQAQIDWDYSAYYAGAANVYYGPLAPPSGHYLQTGIVVAPSTVASEERFTGAEWPALYGSTPTQQFTWLGRFKYTIPYCQANVCS